MKGNGNVPRERGHPVGGTPAGGGSGEEYAGYYCLLIALFCELNASQAWMLYWNGSDYPACRRMMQKKGKEAGAGREGWMLSRMRELTEAGYSLDALFEAFGCGPAGQ